MLVFQLQSQEGVKGQENKKNSFQINIFCVISKNNFIIRKLELDIV